MKKNFTYGIVIAVFIGIMAFIIIRFSDIRQKNESIFYALHERTGTADDPSSLISVVFLTAPGCKNNSRIHRTFCWDVHEALAEPGLAQYPSCRNYISRLLIEGYVIPLFILKPSLTTLTHVQSYFINYFYWSCVAALSIAELNSKHSP
jgi:hypothetical protein